MVDQPGPDHGGPAAEVPRLGQRRAEQEVHQAVRDGPRGRGDGPPVEVADLQPRPGRGEHPLVHQAPACDVGERIALDDHALEVTDRISVGHAADLESVRRRRDRQRGDGTQVEGRVPEQLPAAVV